MKKLFLLFSHTLTPIQEQDAKESMGIEAFVKLPDDLQKLWSNIPPYLTTLDVYLEPLKSYILQNASKDDVFLIQVQYGKLCQISRHDGSSLYYHARCG